MNCLKEMHKINEQLFYYVWKLIINEILTYQTCSNEQ